MVIMDFVCDRQGNDGAHVAIVIMSESCCSLARFYAVAMSRINANIPIVNKSHLIVDNISVPLTSAPMCSIQQLFSNVHTRSTNLKVKHLHFPILSQVINAMSPDTFLFSTK